MPVLIVPRGRFNLEHVLRRQGLPDEHQTRWIAIRQRPQQHGVEQREDGAVDADAQGQRQHDEQGERGPADRVAPRERHITKQQIELQGLTPDVSGVGDRACRPVDEAERRRLLERMMAKLRVPLALPVAALPPGHEPRCEVNEAERELERGHRACFVRSRAASKWRRVSSPASSAFTPEAVSS